MSASGTTDAGLTSREPVDVSGAIDLFAGAGAVRASAADAEGVRLTAEAITIEHDWQRGVHVQGPLSRSTYVVERDGVRVGWGQAEVRLGAPAEGRFLLAYAGDPTADFRMTSPRGFTFEPAADVTLVGVGEHPESGVVGDSHLGFWHTTEGATIRGIGGGFLRADGSFSLFVHNVTVQAEGDGGSWSEWTGYREVRPGQPVTEFERRVTVIHVTNGTLLVPSREQLAFAVPAFDAEADGTITFPSVSGRLLESGQSLLFDREPLTMNGAGGLSMRALADPTPSLAVETSPGFHPLGFQPSGDAPARSLGSTTSMFSFAGLALLVLATVSMNELGVIPGPTPALQRRRHARWMRRGRWAALRERWALSAWCYEKAVRAKRDDALAWYDWSYAELEAGHLAAADAVARRATEIRGVDPLDLLEVRAAVAWERGDAQGFAEHVTALAKDAPEMARGLVADMRINVEDLEPRVRKTLEYPRTEVLDGYG